MYIILIAFTLAAAYVVLSKTYQKRWSKNLKISIEFSSQTLFEGERGEVIETFTNYKLLPVFWCCVQFRTSHFIQFGGTNLDHDYYKQDTISAVSYEEIKRRLPFKALRRGYYRLNDFSAVAGDFLFNYKMILRLNGFSEIYVYPGLLDTKRFEIDFNKIIGEAVSRRSLIEDPFFFRGIRDYNQTDSMKKINWNATARTGCLKVNQFYSTNSQKVMLLLDLDGCGKWDGQEIKEDAIRIAAVLAQKLCKKGIAAGLITNAADIISGGAIETDCKNGHNHYFYLLREMAKINTDRLLTSFDKVLEYLKKDKASKVQYILISYVSGEALVKQVSQFESDGINIQWILLKDKSRKTDFVKRRNMHVCEVDY